MGITDGTVWCGWCGEEKTSCALCGGLAPMVGPGTRDENTQRRIIQEREEDRLRVIGK